MNVNKQKFSLNFDQPYFILSLAGLFIGLGFLLSGPQIELMQRVQGLTVRYPDELWRCFNLFGHFLGAAFLVLMMTREAVAVFALVLATILGAMTIRLLKLGFNEVRPAALMPDELHVIGERLSQHAMPSGHSMTIAIVFGLLVSLDLNRADRSKVLIPLLMMVFGVGLARIASGAHWPADVLVGIGLGVFIGYLSARLTLGQTHRLPKRAWLSSLSRLLLAIALVLTPLPPSHSREAAVVLALLLASLQCLQWYSTRRSTLPNRP